MRSGNKGTAWTRTMEIVSRLIRSIQCYSSGIQARLISLFLLLSLLPLAIGGIVAFQSGKASLEANIGAQLESRAQRILDEIERMLTGGQSSLQNWSKLSVMYDLVGDDPDGRITGTLMTLARESSSLGQFMAISPRGAVVAASQPYRIGEQVADTV